MLPENRVATHPGEVLRKEYLEPMGLSPEALAEHIGRPAPEIAALSAEEAPVTAELAWLLSMAFDTTPEFWLNLQANHDLTRCRPDREVAALTG